ncbi:MAG: ribosome recycling factor [Candidatus Omnitrophica bacterium]|jgi:ribosome recycling factor|nr:ribosome recycling factor [Candidatus Omnitrophota bacterium]
MYEEIFKQTEVEMKKAEEAFLKEIGTLRLGRASVSLLEEVFVDYYGSKLPINQIATITIPQPQLLLIQPWDKSMLEKIVKAIQVSNIGLNPLPDASVIRISVPPLSQERRNELVKILKKMEEQVKIEIREIRRKKNEEIKKIEKDKEISEDESFKLIERIQKLTDKFIEELEKKTSTKEKEILK